MEQVSNFLASFELKPDDVISITSDCKEPSAPVLDPQAAKKRSSGMDLATLWGSVTQAIQSQPEDASKPDRPPSGTSSHLTDKLFERLIAMALPTPSSVSPASLEERLAALRARPSLSVPLMSKNFILMNARLSGAFVMLDEGVRIFTWQTPTYTLGLLCIYSWLVLRPALLLSLPFAYVVLAILVPNYMALHAPDHIPGITNRVPTQGPPWKTLELPKPAPETSREFFLNVTDLQNHMLLYVAAYDAVNTLIVSTLCYEDEAITNCVFVAFIVVVGFNLTLGLWLVAHLSLGLVKSALLLAGWGVTVAGHPSNTKRLLSLWYAEETRARFRVLARQIEATVRAEFLLEAEPRETRTLEAYEVQRLGPAKQWLSAGFTVEPHRLFSLGQGDALVVANLSGVEAPAGWVFSLAWTMDLSPTLWVLRHVVEEVSIDHNEKWVYDVDSVDQHRRRRWTRLCTRVVAPDWAAKSLCGETLKTELDHVV